MQTMAKLVAILYVLGVILVLTIASPLPTVGGDCECRRNVELNITELICKKQSTVLPDFDEFNCDFDKVVITSSEISVISNDSFVNVPELSIVHLYTNNIDTVEQAAFRVLSNLREIDLSDNDLTAFDPWIFSENAQLETVALSSNYLVDIDESSPILSSDSVTTLLLDDCKLTTITKEMLSDLPNLKKLDISSNDLETLPLSVFDGVPNLNRLELHNNRWSCDCDLKYLMIFADKIREDKSIQLEPVKCVTPERNMVIWSDEVADKYCSQEEIDVEEVTEVLETDVEDLNTETSTEIVLLAGDSFTSSISSLLENTYVFATILALFIMTLILTACVVCYVRKDRRALRTPTNSAYNKDNKFYMLNVHSHASAFTSTDQLIPNAEPRDVIVPMYSDQLPLVFQYPARSNIHIYEPVAGVQKK